MRRLALGFVAIAAAAGSNCASFRAGWMDLRNEDLVGEVAPPLDRGVWVDSEPWPLEGPPDADWYLVAFMLPW